MPEKNDPTGWVIHCDGSARPNPGRMGLGAVLTGPDGVVRHQISEATSLAGCNNEAELRALIQALQWLLQQGVQPCTPVQVYTDSSVLVEQLGPRPAAPIVRLEPLFGQARAVLQQLQQVDLCWVPRHRNRAADVLARAALGLPPKALPPSGGRVRRQRR